MKALIVSDNHGSKELLQTVLKRHGTDADVMIHCGDSELPADSEEMQPFIKVAGNCDVDPQYPNEVTKELGGIPFFVTHGHHYNVKMSLMNLMYKAEETAATVICYGHSHIAQSFQENGKIFINPGSIRLPRMRREGTYVICEKLEDGRLNVSYYSEDGEKIEALTANYPLYL
ncbi:metallophosphoesterase family protein [Pseudalkalibacillus caeni]|uniref:Phosphoesterase n=1 Tax=Exobacillus caeni TaxID=2574798 RepID=A0A5R9FI09_9BACL|nr:metallophosphoesterase [Pseudalkalibacillus caeni]TLS39205.1 metallophosphoesterase [Pseudalkalibacillus caeni]